mmetsp:Transcript_29717/g.53756  ORF Transcript_29717/g.53756 Transcript_29717/m.53756 type:complete len:98 (+) Transcript_29717:375-668(+)
MLPRLPNKLWPKIQVDTNNYQKAGQQVDPANWRCILSSAVGKSEEPKWTDDWDHKENFNKMELTLNDTTTFDRVIDEPKKVEHKYKDIATTITRANT